MDVLVRRDESASCGYYFEPHPLLWLHIQSIWCTLHFTSIRQLSTYTSYLFFFLTATQSTEFNLVITLRIPISSKCQDPCHDRSTDGIERCSTCLVCYGYLPGLGGMSPEG